MNYISIIINIAAYIIKTKKVANFRLAYVQLSIPEASRIMLIRPNKRESNRTACLNVLVAYEIFILINNYYILFKI